MLKIIMTGRATPSLVGRGLSMHGIDYHHSPAITWQVSKSFEEASVRNPPIQLPLFARSRDGCNVHYLPNATNNNPTLSDGSGSKSPSVNHLKLPNNCAQSLPSIFYSPTAEHILPRLTNCPLLPLRELYLKHGVGGIMLPQEPSSENHATEMVGNTSRLLREHWIIFYAGCPIIWTSKLQSQVDLSTTEAEYISPFNFPPRRAPNNVCVLSSLQRARAFKEGQDLTHWNQGSDC